MIKKTLVFHIYVYESENYLENEAYKFHIECLKRYSNVFDKACFNISCDNINDIETINSIKCDLVKCGFNNIEIITTKNDYFCEVNTFKYFILDRLENLNELIFFGHTKGITNINDGINYPENILHWVYTMYFFNLEEEYIINMENMVIKSFGGGQNTFYGTLKQTYKEMGISFYPGTFYWVNPMKLYEDNRQGKAIIPKIYNRNFCEELPYIYKNINNPHEGVSSCFNRHYTNLWLYNDNDWNEISFFLSGENNTKYLEIYDNIRKNIENEK
jgi:hypothetical protein